MYSRRPTSARTSEASQHTSCTSRTPHLFCLYLHCDESGQRTRHPESLEERRRRSALTYRAQACLPEAFVADSEYHALTSKHRNCPRHVSPSVVMSRLSTQQGIRGIEVYRLPSFCRHRGEGQESTYSPSRQGGCAHDPFRSQTNGQ